MPFLVAELKSNATGGNTWHAQNQAAGSGTYCVSAMKWLLDQAHTSSSETDSAAFSLAASGSVVTLSIHWQSKEDRAYYMSYVKGFIPTDMQHVQECHDMVKNIVEWGIGPRHKILKGVLQTFFPLPDHWTRKRTASTTDQDDSSVSRASGSRDRHLSNTENLGDKRSSATVQSMVSNHSDAARGSKVHQSQRR